MENEYKNNHVKVANPKPFRFFDFLLRILAMGTTFVAAIVMGLAKETETVPFVLIPGTAPLFVPVSARMRYSSSFVYFVVANAIACAYSAFSLLVTIGGCKGSRALALGITILDVIMMALLFSGNGAATAVGLLGYKGNSHVGWNKATRTSIVDGTVSYIQELENTLQELEARKKAQLNNRFSLQTVKTSSVDVTVSGSTAFFGIRSLSRKGLASTIIGIFEAHKAEVLSTGIASEEGREMSMTVNAVINGGEGGEAVEFVMSKIKRDLLVYLS